MKHTIVACIAMALAYQILPGKALDTLSTRMYPCQKYDYYAAAMDRTADSGLIIVTNSNGDFIKNSILKLDKNTNVQWQGRFGDTVFSYWNITRGVLETSTGEFFAFGNATVPLNILDTTLSFITIFSADGKQKATVLFPNLSIRKAKKQNGLIYGLATKGNNTTHSTVIDRFNEQATMVSEIPLSLTDSVIAYDFFPLNDGFICYGQHYRQDLTSIAVLYRFDVNGQIVWKQTYGNYSVELSPETIELTDDGSIIEVVVEPRRSPQGLVSDEKVILLKYSLNGDLLWDNSARTITTTGTVDFNLDMLPGDKAIMLGGKAWRGQNDFNQIILPFDSLGNPLHNSIFRLNSYDKVKIMQFNAHRLLGITTRCNPSPYTNASDSVMVCIMDLGWNFPPYFITKQNEMTGEVLEDSTYFDTVTALDSFPTDHSSYSLGDSIPQGMQIDRNTGKISWTPRTEKDSGSHAITVVATDNVGQSDTLRFSLHVTPQNDPPVIDSIRILKNADSLGDTVSLRASAWDEEGDKLSYSWTRNGAVLPGTDSIISYAKTDTTVDTIVLSVNDPGHRTSRTLFLPGFASMVTHQRHAVRRNGLHISRKAISFVFPDGFPNGTYKMSLFNLQGALVRTIVMGDCGAGRFIYNLSAGLLKNGIYMIAVTGPGIKLRMPFFVMN